MVLERADTLRDTGAAIGIQTNGWRALDQLGVGSKLRQTAIPLIGVSIAQLYMSGNRFYFILFLLKDRIQLL